MALKSWERIRRLIPLARMFQRSASGRALWLFAVTWVLMARAWKTGLYGRADFPLVFSGRSAWRHPCRGTMVLSVALGKHQNEDVTLQSIGHLHGPQS